MPGLLDVTSLSGLSHYKEGERQELYCTSVSHFSTSLEPQRAEMHPVQKSSIGCVCVCVCVCAHPKAV